METTYIYETPFDGTCRNTMHNGFVDYTGEQKNVPIIDENGLNRGVRIEFINPLNFEQYNAKHGGNLKTANEEEFFTMLKQYENEKVITLFKEITEDEWNYFLNVLPPARWHNYKNLEIFFVSECYTSNIYNCVLKDSETKKHYSALRRINETSEQILETFNKSIA